MDPPLIRRHSGAGQLLDVPQSQLQPMASLPGGDRCDGPTSGLLPKVQILGTAIGVGDDSQKAYPSREAAAASNAEVSRGQGVKGTGFVDAMPLCYRLGLIERHVIRRDKQSAFDVIKAELGTHLAVQLLQNRGRVFLARQLVLSLWSARSCGSSNMCAGMPVSCVEAPRYKPHPCSGPQISLQIRTAAAFGERRGLRCGRPRAISSGTSLAPEARRQCAQQTPQKGASAAWPELAESYAQNVRATVRGRRPKSATSPKARTCCPPRHWTSAQPPMLSASAPALPPPRARHLVEAAKRQAEKRWLAKQRSLWLDEALNKHGGVDQSVRDTVAEIQRICNKFAD